MRYEIFVVVVTGQVTTGLGERDRERERRSDRERDRERDRRGDRDRDLEAERTQEPVKGARVGGDDGDDGETWQRRASDPPVDENPLLHTGVQEAPIDILKGHDATA